MEEEPKDVAVDTNTEVEETTNSNKSGDEETTDLAEELEKERKAKAQILARAKKAEEELKNLKNQPAPQIKSEPQLSDELKLIARGLSDEAIEQAKVIAKGKDIILTEAIKDPLFITWQKTQEEKERREKAKLGASKGSNESSDNFIVKPNMTREEHIEAFKKVNGIS